MGRRRNGPKDLLGVGSGPAGLLHKFGRPPPAPRRSAAERCQGGGRAWWSQAAADLDPVPLTGPEADEATWGHSGGSCNIFSPPLPISEPSVPHFERLLHAALGLKARGGAGRGPRPVTCQVRQLRVRWWGAGLVGPVLLLSGLVLHLTPTVVASRHPWPSALRPGLGLISLWSSGA